MDKIGIGDDKYSLSGSGYLQHCAKLIYKLLKGWGFGIFSIKGAFIKRVGSDPTAHYGILFGHTLFHWRVMAPSIQSWTLQ